MADEEPQALHAALMAAGVGWDQVAECRPFGTQGTFSDVRLVILVDGRRLVVKIPPGPQTPILQYERGIMGTEALYYRLTAGCPGVTVPEVLAVNDDGGGAGTYLVMTECPGQPWPACEPPSGGPEREALRAELGRQVACLHTTVTGPGFGYPSLALGPLHDSWRVAFLGMVAAVLVDAGRFGVSLPRPAAEIALCFARQAAVLDEITTPVLVHFDLWDGNILVGTNPGGRRIGALIDAERAFWGDPVAELVSLSLFSSIEDDAAFLDAYRAGGGAVTFDTATRLRLAMYRAYLFLIMWVEAVPRQFDQERLDWLLGFAYEPLAAMLDTW